MKKVMLLVLFVMMFNSLIAQELATISGRIYDKKTSKPLAFTNIVIKSKTDKNFLTGTMAGDDGRFTMSGIPRGEYSITCSFIGYASNEIDLYIGELNKIFDLGKIELEPENIEMDEVTIEARRSIISPSLDKKSYAISDNVSQSGGSVLEAMRNLPGVTVDPEGKILLRGSDKVLVLIDNAQSSLTGYGNQKGLDNLPSANVERIEIINNPSAKFDAKGMAGIINIVYKKEKEEGLNVELNFATGVGELTVRQDNLPNIMDKYSFTPKINPGFGLNYRTKKVNFFLLSDGMVRRRINNNTFTSRNYFDNTADIESQFLENRTQQLYNIKGGIDWFINETDKLTMFALWEDEYHIDRGHVPYDNKDNGKRIRFWTWEEDERTKFINYSANYNHKFAQAGHEISATYLYTGGGEDELFPFTDSSAYRNSVDETFLQVYEYVHNFNIDYVKPLRSGRLELGTKISLRNIPIDYDVRPGINSILDLNLGDWSDYNEDVYAGYVNYIRESKKYDIEAGLRLEQTYLKYEIDPGNLYYTKKEEYDYFEPFPNVRLTYKINMKNRISVFYNRRIDRPGEFELRPFPKYDDPEILKTGNPYLRPQFTKTVEFAYKNIWETGSAYFSCFYRMIDDLFSRVYTSDTTSLDYTIVHTIPQNLGDGTNLGLELSFEQSISQKWQLNGSLSWYQNWINAASGTHLYPYSQDFFFNESKSSTWNFKLNSRIQLPCQSEFQLTGVYYAPNILPQGRIKERYSIDFGIKKKALNGKAEFMLAATDILNGFAIEKEINGETFDLKAYNYYETQVVTIGFKYKF